MIAAEANGTGIRGRFRELQTECLALHTEVSAGLIDVLRMAEHSIKIHRAYGAKGIGSCRLPALLFKTLKILLCVGCRKSVHVVKR